jgi:NADP-dependent aldehyde dehydrogenase
VAEVDSSDFIDNPTLHEEVFGPYSLLVKGTSKEDLLTIAGKLKGQLTITVMANQEDLDNYRELISLLREKTGRLIFNGVPTGVEVCSSMNHGGPFPATTDSRYTSVGTAAIKRFARPISFQDMPDSILPNELKNNNPLGIWRHQDGDWTKDNTQ